MRHVGDRAVDLLDEVAHPAKGLIILYHERWEEELTFDEQKTHQDPRRETLAQRDDRNLVELIQELRVVGLGVQVLFGFLLSLPFTVRFSGLSQGQRDLYVASITLSAVATILLLGPVAYHRMVFREGMKESLVRFSNAMAISGLAAVAGAVLTAVFLVITSGRPPDLDQKVVELPAERPTDIDREVHDELLQLLHPDVPVEHPGRRGRN